jgi:DNA (cytosine-5)-methyltransferase 1
MRHGSLFSGIGGFDLAAEWMGWTNVFHCEINPFGQKVLKHYWPGADLHEDIIKTDFTRYANTIDVLTGGFPCQPFSMAGKRKGTEDDRHLWPEMLRVIREVQPKWVVGENVFGLINWDGGMVFDQVQIDLEAEGYEVQAYVLPAVSQDAPHRRDRVWFVAYRNRRRLEGTVKVRRNGKYVKRESIFGTPSDPDSNGQHRCNGNYEVNAGKRGQYAQCYIGEGIEYGTTTDPCIQGHKGSERRRSHGQRNRTETSGSTAKRFEIQSWNNWPTQSPVCSGNDGIPRELDGITFPKWRNESIKAMGNAIVPQVVYQIFKAINEYELGSP